VLRLLLQQTSRNAFESLSDYAGGGGASSSKSQDDFAKMLAGLVSTDEPASLPSPAGAREEQALKRLCMGQPDALNLLRDFLRLHPCAPSPPSYAKDFVTTHITYNVVFGDICGKLAVLASRGEQAADTQSFLKLINGCLSEKISPDWIALASLANIVTGHKFKVPDEVVEMFCDGDSITSFLMLRTRCSQWCWIVGRTNVSIKLKIESVLATS
jgi:hypothetical protein